MMSHDLVKAKEDGLTKALNKLRILTESLLVLPPIVISQSPKDEENEEALSGEQVSQRIYVPPDNTSFQLGSTPLPLQNQLEQFLIHQHARIAVIVGDSWRW